MKVPQTGVFDLKTAFLPYNGCYSPRAFRDMIAQVRSDNMGNIIVEWGVEELFNALCLEGWVTETLKNQIQLKVGRRKPAIKKPQKPAVKPCVAAMNDLMDAVANHLSAQAETSRDGAFAATLKRTTAQLETCYRRCVQLCGVKG